MISIKFQVKVNKRGDTPEKRHFYDSIIGSHQAEDEEVDDDGYVPDNFIFPYFLRVWHMDYLQKKKVNWIYSDLALLLMKL